MLESEGMKINYAPYMIKEQVIPFVRELQSAQNLKMLILRFPSTIFYDVERWVNIIMFSILSLECRAVLL